MLALSILLTGFSLGEKIRTNLEELVIYSLGFCDESLSMPPVLPEAFENDADVVSYRELVVELTTCSCWLNHFRETKNHKINTEIHYFFFFVMIHNVIRI